MLLFHFFVYSALQLSCSSTNPNPHIIFVLSDDLGYSNVEWHNKRMQTPHLMNLLSESLLLSDFYAYKYCSPSRSSLLSGRESYHVNEANGPACAPKFGIPAQMTTISQKLVIESNYIGHQIGKWHCGCSSNEYLPIGRNFTSSLGYICHALEDHWTQNVTTGNCSGIDLYDTDKPAFGQNGTYGGYIYANRAVEIINKHNKNHANQPLFLYLATQNNHDPFQVPQQYIDKFNSSWDEIQRTVAAMSNFEDELVYNVTSTLKNNGMWDNTLFVMVADNGGQVAVPNQDVYPEKWGGNNSPLRGGKFSNFQGGIRVNGLISGGYLPKHRMNSTLHGYVHVSDWYSTFCSIVGIDPTDKNAEQYNLPPIDSINMWPFIMDETGDVMSPRNEIFLSSGNDGGLIMDEYKILFGVQTPAFWTTYDYPNGTKPVLISLDCGSIQEGGCLFNIHDEMDPTEHNDIINQTENKAIVKMMRERFIELNSTTFNPDKGKVDARCCAQVQINHGYWGPWLN